VVSASAAAPLPNLRNLTERADAAVAVSDAMRTMQPPIQRAVPVFAVVPRPTIPQPGGDGSPAPESGGQAPGEPGPDSPPPPSADAARLL
jgi:hypothetical protein